MPPITPYPAFPFSISFPVDHFSGLFTGLAIEISVQTGLTTLLGPNGAGKTSVLKALRDHLKGTYGDGVRYLSAGRMGVVEHHRSNNDGNSQGDPNDTYIGGAHSMANRRHSETIIGDFLAMKEKADLRLKVQSRLEGLFNKTLTLEWLPSGLKVNFAGTGIGAAVYGAGNEASGLMQLVAILASLYDDDIKFLLIDEPEVSLHPQLQAFILNEIKSMAGDPNLPFKKCIFISTHAPAMLSLKIVSDLKSIVFFKDPDLAPLQILTSNPVMSEPNLANLILRLSEAYKIGFFAKGILLSEGVSDELVVNTVAEIKKANFPATGIQIMPVSGKFELPVADMLFSLIGKKVQMLADLDVLDDDIIINYIRDTKNTLPAVLILGFADLNAQFNDMKSSVTALIASNWADIDAQAQTQNYYKSGNPQERYRSVLSFLAPATTAQVLALPNHALWDALRIKVIDLLNVLDENGLVLIRKGSIEDCYLNPAIPATFKKPQAAMEEANFLLNHTPTSDIDASYQDVIKAIEKLKATSKVDEAGLLRLKLGSVIGAIQANFNSATTNQNILDTMNSVDKDLASIFKIEKSAAAGDILDISLVSPLFLGYAPFQVNMNSSLQDLQNSLPSN